MLDRVLDWLLPEGCAACGQGPGAGGALLCPACAEPCLLPHRFRIEGCPVFAAFRHREPIKSVIHQFKYSSRPELARRLARAVVERAPELATLDSPVLVPVPLHPKRLAERGYNQSALLAQGLARILGVATSVRALERRSDTRHQVTLSREERSANLREQIALRARPARDVVLVDDVFTTGATARACFDALRSGGVNPLAVVTVAIAE